MATNTPRTRGPASNGESAKQVAIDVLRTAGEPLPAKEIAKRVIASGRCTGLKGKTPAATIAAMLAVGAKPAGPFTRIDKGTYTIAGTLSTRGERTQREPERQTPARAKTAQTRKPARAKPNSTAATSQEAKVPD